MADQQQLRYAAIIDLGFRVTVVPGFGKLEDALGGFWVTQEYVKAPGVHERYMYVPASSVKAVLENPQPELGYLGFPDKVADI